MSAIIISSGNAVAIQGEIVGDSVISKSFDIRFNEKTSPARIVLSPVRILSEDDLTESTVVGNGQIDLGRTLSENQSGAIRWNPSHGKQFGVPDSITYSGDNNPDNKLTVTFDDGNWKNAGTEGWHINTSAQKIINFVIKKVGSEKTPSDTYTMYLDAGIYSY